MTSREPVPPAVSAREQELTRERDALRQRSYRPRTFQGSDGVVRCEYCCNKDGCDDTSHFERRHCPFCHGTGLSMRAALDERDAARAAVRRLAGALTAACSCIQTAAGHHVPYETMMSESFKQVDALADPVVVAILAAAAPAEPEKTP